MTRRLRALLAVPSLGAALLAGCAGGGSSASSGTTATGPAPTFTALIYRAREDEAVGRLMEIKLTNTSSFPLTVTSTRLRDHGFVPVPAAPKDVDFAAGELWDLRTPIGAASCPAAPVTAPKAEIGWRAADGRTGLSVVAATVEDDVLSKTRREECAQDELTRTATVAVVVDPAAVGRQRPGSGPGARTPAVLRLHRPDGGTRAGDDVRVLDLTGSILYDLLPAPGVTWPRTMPGGRPALDVPLLVGTTSCSGHVLGEIKKPFQFLAHVTVAGSADPVVVTVDVDGASRAALRALVARVCAGR